MDLSKQKGKKYNYKLKRRLCESKQAPRTWYKRVNIYLRRKGIIWNNLDYNHYFFHDNGKPIKLILCLDDLLMIKIDSVKIN